MKEQWEYNILRCINSLGGEACLEDIYDKIGKFIELTGEHRRETIYKEPAFHIQVRKHISNLFKKKGELKKVSPGCYSLREKGYERLMREKPIEDAEGI